MTRILAPANAEMVTKAEHVKDVRFQFYVFTNLGYFGF